MEIVWTEEASSNLQKIYDYISKENIKAADDTIDGIYNRAQLLLNHPNIGYIYQKQKLKDYL